MHWYNIHSHQISSATNEVAIINVHENFNLIGSDNFYSIGFHPWYINQYNVNAYHQLQIKAQDSNIIAIGECGLDKLCAIPFEHQLQAFDWQIQLANQIQKPLIIHCVKAYTEVMERMKYLNNKVPVIFHGYNKSIALAQQLQTAGYYISLGAYWMNASKIQKLKQLDLNRILLETDQSTISIQHIYQNIAQAFDIELNAFSLQIEKNVEQIFGTLKQKHARH